MLVLSGKMGRLFVIDRNIALEVGERVGHRRKLHIIASQQVRILRDELGGKVLDHDREQEPDEEPELDDFGRLVLSRIAGEAIRFEVCGQSIGKIILLENKTNVRLGFEFANDVEVLRQIVFQRENLGVDRNIFDNPAVRRLLPAQ